MNNKRGQVAIMGLMLGITIIILALALAQPTQENIEIALNESNLDCDNSSISYFSKTACIATDSMGFYFIGSILIIGGIVIGARIIFD